MGGRDTAGEQPAQQPGKADRGNPLRRVLEFGERPPVVPCEQAALEFIVPARVHLKVPDPDEEERIGGEERPAPGPPLTRNAVGTAPSPSRSRIDADGLRTVGDSG